jgi:hypothetical protein
VEELVRLQDGAGRVVHLFALSILPVGVTIPPWTSGQRRPQKAHLLDIDVDVVFGLLVN